MICAPLSITAVGQSMLAIRVLELPSVGESYLELTSEYARDTGIKKERQRRAIDKWHLREVPYLLIGEGTIKE